MELIHDKIYAAKDKIILTELPSKDMFTNSHKISIDIPIEFINYHMGTIDLCGFIDHIKNEKEVTINYIPETMF